MIEFVAIAMAEFHDDTDQYDELRVREYRDEARAVLHAIQWKSMVAVVAAAREMRSRMSVHRMEHSDNCAACHLLEALEVLDACDG